jgi:hypothetical protein
MLDPLLASIPTSHGIRLESPMIGSAADRLISPQIGSKAFVPVIAISSDRMLTSANVPWIFRLPQGTPLEQAARCPADAANRTGPNRGKIRDVLASGTSVAGVRLQSTGELKWTIVLEGGPALLC